MRQKFYEYLSALKFNQEGGPNMGEGQHFLKTKKSGGYRRTLQALIALLLIVLATLFILRVMSASDVAALSTPLLAALVAFSLYETVQERRAFEENARSSQRQEERDRHIEERDYERLTNARQLRSQAYKEVINHGISSFTGGVTAESEGVIRTQVSLWGSESFIISYALWRDSISEFAGKGSVTIPVEQRREVQEGLAGVVSSARVDLGIDPERGVSIQQLAATLFDDYTLTKDTE